MASRTAPPFKHRLVVLFQGLIDVLGDVIPLVLRLVVHSYTLSRVMFRGGSQELVKIVFQYPSCLHRSVTYQI
jgi:hypothetical protein